MSEKIINFIWCTFPFLILTVVLYLLYVDANATRVEGCSHYEKECIKSHIETSERYYAKRWNHEEYEVCDEYETVEVPNDCITYHFFWGDEMNY